MPKPVDRLAAFGDQWAVTANFAHEAIAARDWQALNELGHFDYISDASSFINAEGYNHLRRAVEGLLLAEGLSRRVSHRTMERFVVEEFFQARARFQNGQKFSYQGILDRAKRRVSTVEWSNGRYVYPVLFAPKAKNSNIALGPARIVSKEIFLKEHEAALRAEGAAVLESHEFDFYGNWQTYTDRYDHFIVVEMRGFEREMAWENGKEVAEFMLNLVRMAFGFYHTRNIKLAGGNIWEESAANVMIADDGKAEFSHSGGPWGSHLEDWWTERFQEGWAWIYGVLESLCELLANGALVGSPIADRQRYAHQLISEAYCEPHDHIRLVRLISALEAIAVIGQEDKAKSLAIECAQAGGFSDIDAALEIDAAVQAAYKTRNKIVHGDGATPEEIEHSFYGLEKHLFPIMSGFTELYVHVWNAAKPKEVRHLRKELRKRMSHYFWDLKYSE